MNRKRLQPTQSQDFLFNPWNLVRDPAALLQMTDFNQIPHTVFTVNCGEIRPKDEGTRVKISGKVVKRPRTGRFLEIKDMKGSTQLVATDDKPEIGHKFQAIPTDSYIEVIGTVQLRPVNFINNVSIHDQNAYKPC